MTQQLTNILLSALGLIALWWIWFVEYHQLRVDITRQKLFALRDDLFMWAEENNPELFDTKAYVMLRCTMNGLIRFTHQLSFGRLFIVFIFHKLFASDTPGKEYQEEYLQVLKQVPLETRKHLDDQQRRMHTIMLRHVIFSSFFLTVGFYVVRFIQLMRNLKQPISSQRDYLKELARLFLKSKPFRRTWRALDAEALTICHSK